MKLRPLLLAAALALQAAPALAVLPDEKIADPALEARASVIRQRLRCVVCQNQNIDDSAAPLARDMRLIVRERVLAGDTDEQTMNYLVRRYGNFVLLMPPFQPDTWGLWLGPFLVGALGIGGAFLFSRSRTAPAAAAPLTDDERSRLAALLADRHRGKDV